WDWGQVLVAALWSTVAVSLVWTRLRAWAMVTLAACVGLAVLYDLPRLAETQRSSCFALVAVAAFAIAIVYELRSAGPAPAALAALTASVGLGAASRHGLLGGDARAGARPRLASAC